MENKERKHMIQEIERAAEIITQGKVVAFSGAGISVESGIDDFRSPGGLWSRYDPAIYATYSAFLDNPSNYWTMAKELSHIILDAKPNSAHYALVELEKAGFLKCVITQNVDYLHQRAGSSYVLELHGTYKTLHCLDCGAEFTREEIIELLKTSMPPLCQCGGLIKSDTVLFGQSLPQEVYEEALKEAMNCDTMIIAGSSLEVYPAAYIPQVALQNRANIIIVNRTRTPLHSAADIALLGNTGEILPEIVKAVKKRIP